MPDFYKLIIYLTHKKSGKYLRHLAFNERAARGFGKISKSATRAAAANFGWRRGESRKGCLPPVRRTTHREARAAAALGKSKAVEGKPVRDPRSSELQRCQAVPVEALVQCFAVDVDWEVLAEVVREEFGEL